MDAMTGRSLDVGIVTNDTDAMMAFYVDLLGLELVETSPVPGGTMRKLRWGNSAVKIVQLNRRTDISAPRGGLRGATGLRYLTIRLDDLAKVVAACESARVRVVVSATQIRPGLRIAIVEDPDGNWVEFAEEDAAPTAR
jgi:catechol 2,3-dioxygenase-like lactoylglutathione lyase family enzyme